MTACSSSSLRNKDSYQFTGGGGDGKKLLAGVRKTATAQSSRADRRFGRAARGRLLLPRPQSGQPPRRGLPRRRRVRRVGGPAAAWQRDVVAGKRIGRLN